MIESPVGARYAQALFESATAEGAVDGVLRDVTTLGGLIREHEELQGLLRNPDVDPEDKLGLLSRVTGATWAPLTRAFVQMVVTRGRAGFLPEIADAFREMVDHARGRLQVTVRSARPLPPALLERVRAVLAARERKEILLATETAPELIGGVQLLLGSKIIDSSVQHDLEALRQRLTTVRVY